jgi:mono/diheme cytochrome c family protein
MRHVWTLAVTVGVLLGGMPEYHPALAAGSTAAVKRNVDRAVLARGGDLYIRHCASCHGNRAQGAPGWEKPGADGRYPPPPLDGSAHAWHHPMVALKQTIRDGTQRIGGSMPAWRGRLSEPDIEAIIAWFQSTWPDEIYRAWADIDRRSTHR